MNHSPKPPSTLPQPFRVSSLRETITTPGSALAVTARSRDELPVEGDVVGGLYRLVDKLGEGMFGRAYVAERTDVPEHKVALKIMVRAVYAERNVERELVMLAAASHPHIVQLKDHGMTGHYVWLTMPLFEGETLEQRLERGPLGLREAHEIFLPIARGVEALHAAGLRHQDIKPDNIYLARFAGRVHPVLLDLGVAVEHNASFVAGTVLYGAPEQVMALGGHGDGVTLSAEIDTYGLASTLLRSLVGSEFFPGEQAETPYDIASAFIEREQHPLRSGALPGLTGRPRELLIEALQRWLAYDPDERITSQELAEQLEVLLEQEREVDAEIERGLARQKAALQRVRIAAGAMLLVGLGVGAYAYSKRQTLRLAAELDRVRAEGAASFDKLDTCAAAHQLSRRKATQCVEGRGDDKQEFQAALQELSSAGTKAQTAWARRLGTYTTRLRSCEDDAEEATEAWGTERRELVDGWEQQEQSWQQERSKLTSERDEGRRSAEICRRATDELTTSRNECRSDLASCIEDRETCMATPATPAAAPSLAPPKPPVVSEGGAPSAGQGQPTPPAAAPAKPVGPAAPNG